MRTNGTLTWLLSDHLGSTSITATSSGSKTAELRYKACPLRGCSAALREGETRYTYGTTQTTIRYTGQREESSLGLYWYASRWYSATLGRFVSPDSIIPQPGNPQAWDRYGYTYSNPVRYTDPSGHKACSNGGEGSDSCGPDQYENLKFRYRLFKTYIWKPLPEINDIKTGVNFPEKPDGIEWETWTVMVKNRTSEFYEKYREQLFLSGYTMFISEDGMIKDQALISLVISGEFGIYKLTNSQSFTDHLGALSKQYANNSYETYGTAICEGGCPSIKSQLEWLQAFEAIRNKKALAVAFGPNLLPSDLRPRWSTFLVDATTVMGPPFGSYDSWGVGEDGNEILR